MYKTHNLVAIKHIHYW